tara:strand:- start:466 stop:720 length:255 start_codon:yes stop_codon:yes gene_type:complete
MMVMCYVICWLYGTLEALLPKYGPNLSLSTLWLYGTLEDMEEGKKEIKAHNQWSAPLHIQQENKIPPVHQYRELQRIIENYREF